MHQQISAPINSLPLNIVYLSNGQIGLTPRGVFPAIVDQPEQGIHAVIMPDKMLVNGKEILYNTALRYKEIPELLSWLIQQQLEMPV